MSEEKKDKHNKYYWDTKRNYPYNYSSTSDIKMSCPEGLEFNKAYSLDDLSAAHNLWKKSQDCVKEYKVENDFVLQLDRITNEITDLLKEKNAAYGNTALNPAKIFSKLGPVEAIKARLDDKLSRIAIKGLNDDTEDTAKDLIGYLLLLLMAIENESKDSNQQRLDL